jgi:hypothetical protein
LEGFGEWLHERPRSAPLLDALTHDDVKRFIEVESLNDEDAEELVCALQALYANARREGWTRHDLFQSEIAS